MSSGALDSGSLQASSMPIPDGDFELLGACPLCDGNQLKVLDRVANLSECQGCGYVFDNPRPTITALITFYSHPAKYDLWLRQERARDALWTRRLKQLLPVAKPGSLLDVGAGFGQFLALARPCFTEVCGTEVSESAIQIARNKYNLGLLAGEIQEIDFGSKKFDNITMFHVLEHVPDPRAVVQRCASLLVKEGLLAIAVPNDLYTLRNKRLLRTLWTKLLGGAAGTGLQKIVLNVGADEIHLSHFTPLVLSRLLQQCGFAVVANTLDPYYVATGIAKWDHASFYAFCRMIHLIFRRNLYDTILVFARKTS